MGYAATHLRTRQCKIGDFHFNHLTFFYINVYLLNFLTANREPLNVHVYVRIARAVGCCYLLNKYIHTYVH